MGIVRLAKSLRALNALDEFKDRKSDIRNKIRGERVYMDFVSIVYKTQILVSDELNYLLFSFILINMGILNTEEFISDKLRLLITKYNEIIADSSNILNTLTKLNTKIKSTSSSKNIDDDIKNAYTDIVNIVSIDFISTFVNTSRNPDTTNKYVYESVIDFIVDMLTNKITDVEYVLIAFDGIPSFGKIQEQRQRRYMHYAFNEFQKLISSSSDIIDLTKDIKKDVLTARKVFDKDRIQIDIRSAIDHVYNKYHSTDLQKDIADKISIFRQSDPTYVYESSDEDKTNKVNNVIIDVIDRAYGEGEKILVDKLIKDYQTYGNDKSYVFYSPDGDSVLLCLHIYLRTKVNNLTVVKTYNMDPSGQHNESSQYVNIRTLYDNIVNLVQKFTRDKYDKVVDMDSICSDFILLMNFYGNDFIHQIPTMDISTTFMDMMYVYSKFITENDYLTRYQNSNMPSSKANKKNVTSKANQNHTISKVNQNHTKSKENQNYLTSKVHINFKSLIDFIKFLSGYENMMMLDTYIADYDEKQKIIRYFGDVFPCRYMLDYRNHITTIKNTLLVKIKNGLSVDNIKQIILENIDKLNQIVTVSGKKYGDIWLKMEVKNADEYAGKIMASPNILVSKYPRFLFNIRPKKNRSEQEIRGVIDLLEGNLIKNAKSIDLDEISNSNDKIIKDFSFDYSNIRSLVPHDQMPTTDQDIDLYMLEWKSGRWMHILNSYSFEIGYDWKKGAPKKIEAEMKRYQYDVLNSNNTQMDKMIVEYMRTLSWMVDYYMNTNDESTSTEISTWSFNYDRVPFITHISNYLQTITDNNLKNIMKGFYKKTLIPTESYIKSDKHRFYIYPQSTQTIEKIPVTYKVYFPDMLKNIKITIDQFNIKSNGVDETKNNKQNVHKKNRFFDCRMCPYFSKCLFQSKHITFKELMNLNVDNFVQYKIIKNPRSTGNNQDQDQQQSQSQKGGSTDIKPFIPSNQLFEHKPITSRNNNNRYNNYNRHTNQNGYVNTNRSNLNNINNNANSNMYMQDANYKIPLAVRNMYVNKQNNNISNNY